MQQNLLTENPLAVSLPGTSENLVNKELVCSISNSSELETTLI